MTRVKGVDRMCIHVHDDVRSLRNLIYFIEYTLDDRNATSLSKLEARRHSFQMGARKRFLSTN